MNSKILAVIVAAIITSGAGIGIYYGTQTAVNDYAISDPSSGLSEVTNSTINAVNSTIIVGNGSTVIGSNGGLNSGSSTPTSTPEPTATPRVTITYIEKSRNDSELFPYYSNGNIYCVTVTFSLTVNGQSNVQFPTSNLKLLSVDGKNIPNQKVVCSREIIDFNNPPAEEIILKIAVNSNVAEFNEIYGAGYKLVNDWPLTYPIDLVKA